MSLLFAYFQFATTTTFKGLFSDSDPLQAKNTAHAQN